MSNPPPLRLASLGTSPPEGGEEGSEPARRGALPRPLQGERWSAKQTGEGEDKKHPKRRAPGATKRARSLRQAGNQAEALLWLELKANKLRGHHFIRQHPIGFYFADFACRKSRLVIELDGSQHVDSAHDRRRDEFMRCQGWSILRFWSPDVLGDRISVCERSWRPLAATCPQPPPAASFASFPPGRGIALAAIITGIFWLIAIAAAAA